MGDGLAGGDGGAVDVSVTVDVLISVHDQGHFSLSCSQIWARDVDAGADGLLLSQGQCVVSGDFL